MYNTIPVNLLEAEEIAYEYLMTGTVPLLISPPGVGKTTLVQRLAERMQATVRAIRLNTQPPEDATGLQYIDRNAGSTIHLPPAWLPAEDGSDGPTIIFFDELTQASDENRKGVFSVFNERYLGSRRLPDNCYIIAAGNSAEDGTNVYELDRATADRFGVILVKADLDTWIDNYARAHNVDIAIIAFLRVRGDLFETSDQASKSDDVIFPSPRTWADKISPLIKRHRANPGRTEEERLKKLKLLRVAIAGKVGEAVAAAFMQTYEHVANLVSIETLIEMTPKERRENAPTSIDALWAYAQGFIWYATDLDRMRQVYDVLDCFGVIPNIPFFETRAMVAETILNRAAFVHKIPGFLTDPELHRFQMKWKKQVEDQSSVGATEFLAQDRLVA